MVLQMHLRFEEAAKIRDRIQALLVYSEKQKIVDAAEADRDIIGLVRKRMMHVLSFSR